MGDDEPVDDKEASVIRRAKKKMDEIKLLERLIPPIVAAILGVSGGIASNRVEDSNRAVTVESNREQVEKLKADLEMFRQGFLQRVEVEETEREEDIEKLRDRVLYLEARTGVRMEPPAAAVTPPPAN